MNKQFNLTSFTAEYPFGCVRRVICNSMLGQLNYFLINTADKIAQQMISEKVNPVELEPRDIRAIMSAVDDQGDVSLQQAGRIKALQADFYEIMKRTASRSLADLTTQHRPRSLADAVKHARDKEAEEKAPWGSLERAIADAVGVQNAQEIKDLANKRKMLASVGLTATDSMLVELREEQRQRNQMFADKRAGRVGYITWVIEHMFVAPKGDAWQSLTIEEREVLATKVVASMSNVESTVTKNVILGKTGDDVLGVGDLILVRDAKAQLEKLMTAPEAVAIKTTKPKKAKAAKATADAAARKATSELINGIADSANKVKRTSAFVEKLQAEHNGVTTG